MAEFDNGLTDAQEERLEMLAEEAGEVVQCCMKILRHGYNSVGYNNRGDLERELKELWTVYERMAYYEELGRINFNNIGDVWKKKLPFTHYQSGDVPVNHPPVDIPKDVYFHDGNFYSMVHGDEMSLEFSHRWKSRAGEFPVLVGYLTSPEGQSPAWNAGWKDFFKHKNVCGFPIVRKDLHEEWLKGHRAAREANRDKSR